MKNKTTKTTIKEFYQGIRKKPFFVISIIIIVLRYLKLLSSNGVNLSLSQGVRGCNLIGGAVPQCTSISIMNWAYYILLIFFGASFIYTNRNLFLDKIKEYIKTLK